MFSLWDRSGREGQLLVTLWAIFAYDMDFLDDIATCCALLDFQQKRATVAEVFGI